jgi:hypothetical protein
MMCSAALADRRGMQVVSWQQRACQMTCGGSGLQGGVVYVLCAGQAMGAFVSKQWCIVETLLICAVEHFAMHIFGIIRLHS